MQGHKGVASAFSCPSPCTTRYESSRLFDRRDRLQKSKREDLVSQLGMIGFVAEGYSLAPPGRWSDPMISG
jgi:hypothetical protein